MNKKALIEERKRKGKVWLGDEKDTTQSVVPISTRDSLPPSAQIMTSRMSDTDIEAITGRISASIRDEMRRESGLSDSLDLRLAMSEKMDRYLESELHTHTCKVCLALMTSPDNTPMLLFPCGHSFCKCCMNERRERQADSPLTCPFCREAVLSIAVNQSLKDLVDQFAFQRQQLKDGKGKVDDIFPSHRCDVRAATRYRAGYRACEMRRGILLTELENERDHVLESLRKRKKSLVLAENHLQSEKKAVHDKMRLLEEELLLIEQYLQKQHEKIVEVEHQERHAGDKIQLLQKTIREVETEMEKLKVLSEGS